MGSDTITCTPPPPAERADKSNLPFKAEMHKDTEKCIRALLAHSSGYSVTLFIPVVSKAVGKGPKVGHRRVSVASVHAENNVIL